LRNQPSHPISVAMRTSFSITCSISELRKMKEKKKKKGTCSDDRNICNRSFFPSSHSKSSVPYTCGW
jgi:hypothetical protein